MERGRRNGSKAESAAVAVVLKKGPWTAEEDEVLMEYVRNHGPREWSCIRTKGLLPRSGKSCRLRWVNKLKPDLKSGCKFSVEEEQIVIELQARFGNKWARIATYLPGRTDNDVKNFWSTRQKRLARMLQQSAAPLPSQMKKKKKGTQQQKNCNVDGYQQQRNAPQNPIKSLALDPQDPTFSSTVLSEDPCPIGECSSRPCVTANCGFLTATPDFLQLQESQLKANPQKLTPVETTIHKDDDVFRHGTLLDAQLTQFPFPDLPNSLLDLPIVPEDHPLSLGFDDVDGFLGHSFPTQGGMEACDEFFSGVVPSVMPEQGHECPDEGGKVDNGIPDTPDSCFDDFPVDMLDLSDTLPPPS